jgi:hypothetical protein
MNRRAHKRIPISSKALLVVGQRFHRCSLLDCSRQGLAVVPEQPMTLAVGSEIELQSNFGGEGFKCKVRLQYKTEQRLGFQIIDMQPRDASILAQLLSQSAVDNAVSYDRFGALEFNYTTSM